MAERRIYLDWNAGAPVRAEVAASLSAWIAAPGNASSIHGEGRAARARIEAARRDVAALVGAPARGVTFVSGGTEAAVTVLSPDWTFGDAPLRFDRLLVSAVEHPCVARGGRFPLDRVETIPVDGNGVVDCAALQARLAALSAGGERVLVSVMLANNETGVIQPVAEVARLAHAHGALVHSDAVQAAGRIAIDVSALGVDVITLSAHKIGGLPGVGAIVRANGLAAFAPLIVGGGQEARARAGTENAPGIAAFGVAATAARHDLEAMGGVAARRDRILERVRSLRPDAVVFGEAAAARLPNTLAFALPGLAAETALIALDLAGVAVSSGAACSSGKVGASPVLTAMGVDDPLARGALRVSLGPTTTDEEVDRFLAVFEKVLADMSHRHGTRAA